MKKVFLLGLGLVFHVGAVRAQSLFNDQDFLRVRLHAVHNSTPNTLVLVYRLSLCIRDGDEAEARCVPIAQSPRFGVTAGEQITDARVESPPLQGRALNETLRRLDYGPGSVTALQIELFDTAQGDDRITRVFIGLPKDLSSSPRPLRREVAVDSPASKPQYQLRTRLTLVIE